MCFLLFGLNKKKKTVPQIPIFVGQKSGETQAKSHPPCASPHCVSHETWNRYMRRKCRNAGFSGVAGGVKTRFFPVLEGWYDGLEAQFLLQIHDICWLPVVLLFLEVEFVSYWVSKLFISGSFWTFHLTCFRCFETGQKNPCHVVDSGTRGPGPSRGGGKVGGCKAGRWWNISTSCPPVN